MAKSIDLGIGAKRQAPAAKQPIPPPAKQSTAYTGTPPMPEGKIVGKISPAGMTPAEREAFEGIGWTPDIALPDNAAEIIAEALRRQQQTQEAVIPVDPRTPKIVLQTQQLKDLPAADKERTLEALRTAVAEQQARAKLEAAEAAKPPSNVPGLEAAIRTAEQASTRAEQPAAKVPELQIETSPLPAAAPAAATTPDTGAALQPALCPHCHGDLAQPSIPEPPYEDKMSFLHAMLGQKTWTKEYALFGGNIKVVFRTLTPREIDCIYKQAYRDQNMGRVPTDADFWERINRYRLFLQLQCLQSPKHETEPLGLFHDLPDGLSLEANPGATGTWWTPEQDAGIDEGETPLPYIEKWLIEKVFTSEAVFRVVHQACDRFNRLVAKMEAMADNSDFWQPTVAQS